MGNWQLQHSRSLAFGEQRHQDIASIGKFDRVVVAMRHIWFDHTELGNADAGCSRPDPSLVDGATHFKEFTKSAGSRQRALLR